MRRLVLTAVVSLPCLAGADTPPAPAASPSPRPAATARPSVSPAPSASPSAGAAAAKPGAEKKVYTNQDLPAEPSPVAAPSAGPTGGVGRGTVNTLPEAANLPAATRERRDPERNPEVWKERVRRARVAVETAQSRIIELEERITELRNDRGVDNAMAANREQARQAQIAEALTELEVAKGNLERANQARADLEDEARRKNIPPGWLREQ
jgi:hypothetical protein